MVQDLKSLAPAARITLIRPSPYDEVTRPAMAGGGYNPVLVKFGDLLQEMAAKQSMQVADLNGPVVKMLERAQATNADLAARIIPDRVHPGAAGHLIMAAALLDSGRSWVVSEVEIDAKGAKVVVGKNTAISGLSASNGVSWSQTDQALPMPVDLNDAATALAVKSADFLEKFDRETLKVSGLKPGHYALRIDGLQVGVFTAEQLGEGLNLAAWPTPMMKQANEVHALTMKRTGIHNTRWRTIEVPLEADHLAGAKAAMDALDALDTELDAKQRAAAIPVARKYELVPVTADEARIPAGFLRSSTARTQPAGTSARRIIMARRRTGTWRMASWWACRTRWAKAGSCSPTRSTRTLRSTWNSTRIGAVTAGFSCAPTNGARRTR